MRVCGNTAAMLGEGGVSWLAPHFMVRRLLALALILADLPLNVHFMP